MEPKHCTTHQRRPPHILHTKIRGLKCLQTTYSDGKTEIFSYGHGQVSVHKRLDGPIIITEWMPSYVTNSDKTPIARKIFHLKNGQETLVLQRWLDSDNRDRKLFMLKDGKKILYEFSPTTITQKDLETNKIILRKTYDSQKRILSYQNETTLYNFTYPKNSTDKFATLTRTSNNSTTTRQIPLDSLQKILEKL